MGASSQNAAADGKYASRTAKADGSHDTANGRASVGKGESAINGDTVTTRVDMSMSDAHGQHTIQSETQMKYLGSDCQGVTPADEIARQARGLSR
jgi:hypothetical protein